MVTTVPDFYYHLHQGYFVIIFENLVTNKRKYRISNGNILKSVRSDLVERQKMMQKIIHYKTSGGLSNMQQYYYH